MFPYLFPSGRAPRLFQRRKGQECTCIHPEADRSRFLAALGSRSAHRSVSDDGDGLGQAVHRGRQQHHGRFPQFSSPTGEGTAGEAGGAASSARGFPCRRRCQGVCGALSRTHQRPRIGSISRVLSERRIGGSCESTPERKREFKRESESEYEYEYEYESTFELIYESTFELVYESTFESSHEFPSEFPLEFPHGSTHCAQHRHPNLAGTPNDRFPHESVGTGSTAVECVTATRPARNAAAARDPPPNVIVVQLPRRRQRDAESVANDRQHPESLRRTRARGLAGKRGTTGWASGGDCTVEDAEEAEKESAAETAPVSCLPQVGKKTV